MTYEFVIYEKRGRIAYVTLNRPEVMNALHIHAHRELSAVWDDFAGDPEVWLAILTVATLRSPFLPHAYAGFPPLWLITLLAARAGPSTRALALLIGAFAVLNFYWPIDWPIDPRLLATITTLLPQAATMAIAFWVVWRALRYGDEPSLFSRWQHPA